jgi:hypothetical protein
MIKRKPGGPVESGRVTNDIASPVRSGRTDGVARPISAMRPEAIDNYLVDTIAQLECLARAANKDMLAYLLSMASIQAAAPEARWDRSNALH